jgi:alpha-methylacyl-CoA racemase
MLSLRGTVSVLDERESFLLDGGAPYYRTYETSDGGYMAVGSIEPQFFAQLLAGLGLSADEIPGQFELARYDEMRAVLAERFATKTRDEWTEIFAGTDACVTPVLTWGEAADNEHLRARSTLLSVDGVDQAAPAPRFSRTPTGTPGTPPKGTTAIADIGWT